MDRFLQGSCDDGLGVVPIQLWILSPLIHVSVLGFVMVLEFTLSFGSIIVDP